MQKKYLALSCLFLFALMFSGCGDNTAEKRLPKEVVSPTPAPYTGEPGQEKKPSLTVYQVNPDGSSQEVTSVTEKKISDTSPTVETGLKGMIISADGFTPSSVTMKVGTKIMIQNGDSAPHQPASDPHPEHTLCPELNAEAPLQKDGVFEVVMTEAKTCTIHDHLNPELKATIIVTE